MSAIVTADLSIAVEALKSGGVIAYPTESCFGLGCDPTKPEAIKKIISIKQRSADKGLILIAANTLQATEYVTIEGSQKQSITESWPGPNTWLLAPKESAHPLLRGEFPLQAMRVTAHDIANQLCDAFGGAIVSTSANLASQAMLTHIDDVSHYFGDQLDVILDAPIGNDTSPSTIRNGLTGEILRQ